MNYLDINSFIGKENGNPIYASTWNGVFERIQTKVNEIIDALANGGYANTDPVSTESNVVINGETYTSNRIVLPAGKDYVISGTVNGQIVFDAKSTQPTENTNVTFNGVTIVSNEDYAVLYETPEQNKGYKDLVITLARDSENYIVCNKVVAPADDQPGAIYSMNNLAIKGVGYLAVYNKGGHGIRGTETLIVGPRMYIDVEHDAIHGKKLSIDYGTIVVENANDIIGTADGGEIIVGDPKIFYHTISGKIYDAKNGNVYSAGEQIPSTAIGLSSKQNTIVSKIMTDAQADGLNALYTIEQSDNKSFTSVESVPSTIVKSKIASVSPSSNQVNLDTRILKFDLAPNVYEGDVELKLIDKLGNDISSSVKLATNTTYKPDDESVYTTTNISLPYTFKSSESRSVIEFDLDGNSAGEFYLGVYGNGEAAEFHITKPYVRCSGTIEFPIVVDETFPNGNYETSEVDLYLNNAYLTKGVKFNPTSDRIKVIAQKDTNNVIMSDTDDAIESENNIRIEVKNNAHLYLSAPKGSCINGDEVIITDSKGTLVLQKYGKCGIKGTSVVIGPNAKVKSGTITAYTDPESADYATFDGAIVVYPGPANKIGEGENAYEHYNWSVTGSEIGKWLSVDLTEWDGQTLKLNLTSEGEASSTASYIQYVDRNGDVLFCDGIVYDWTNESLTLTEKEYNIMQSYNVDKIVFYGVSDENYTSLPYFNPKSLEIVEQSNPTNTGKAGIYARQGKKMTKGTFFSTNNELNGVVITDSIGATIGYNAADVSHLYYHFCVDGNAANLVQKTAQTYYAKPHNAAGISSTDGYSFLI